MEGKAEEVTQVYRINISKVGNRAKQLEQERKAVIEFNIQKVIENFCITEKISEVLTLQQDNEKMEYEIYYNGECVRKFQIKIRNLR